MLFPEPLEPTSAVVVPAGARKLTSLAELDARVVFEGDLLEHDLPVDDAERRAGASSSSSVRISISSWMRSRPANASVICVPIEAICITGAAIRPVNRM